MHISDLKYYSNGKLMLTGEFLVLKGAKALAIPLNKGQSLEISYQSTENQLLKWKSWENDELWYEAEINLNDFELQHSTDPQTGQRLKLILNACRKLNKDFLQSKQDLTVRTNMNFLKKWGLGSSSTLISNLAYWAEIDPYELLSNTFPGSGYDIACARSDQPLIFQLVNEFPVVNKSSFDPYFSSNLYFVYTGRKQQSQSAVFSFLHNWKQDDQLINTITDITTEFISCTDQKVFNQLLITHEKLLARVLKRKPIKQELFYDFPGEIKSLGAWGGDFILVSADIPEFEVREYFNQKNLQTIFRFADLVK